MSENTDILQNSTDQEARFFAFCNEREQMRVLREEQSKAPPWTDDPIMREWYFCNVFREDDFCTRQVRTHFRQDGMIQLESLVAWCVFTRWLSRGALLDAARHFSYNISDPERSRYDEARVRAWAEEYQQRWGFLFHGAYMLRSRKDKTKLEHLLETARDAENLVGKQRGYKPYQSISHCHAVSMNIQLFGGFMAYELVTDLAHTALITDEGKKERWAYPGPGAQKGLSYIYPEMTASNVDNALAAMLGLLDKANGGAWWWAESKPFSPREIEHCLCEFAKYNGVKGGERGKRRYQTKIHKEKSGQLL